MTFGEYYRQTPLWLEKTKITSHRDGEIDQRFDVLSTVKGKSNIYTIERMLSLTMCSCGFMSDENNLQSCSFVSICEDKNEQICEI
ncbi:hypothetical protein VIGAN_04109300 [Vigna angularis var. angularis]|uniref:Uncharacterized protein n=1 Tax=Vigna angularis var. angularis TaxID=157739 RepID=A0A0S3RTF3_PHAAN|nr:hypothetical protein VIGAN_04109300 [Vigna angularis var. angularis]